MKGGNEMTHEEANRAFEIYKEKKSLKAAAAELDMDRKKLSFYLDYYGLRAMRKISTLNRYDKPFVDKLYEEYQKGSSSYSLGRKYNINPSTITSIFEREGYKRRSNKINSRRFFVNESKFKKIETEEDAYWLGFMFADGYVSKRGESLITGVALAESDKEHLDKLNKYLESSYEVKKYMSGSGYSEGNCYVRLLITSNPLGENLINQGCVLNKTDILKPPTVKPGLIRHFLRGYFDGDGSIFITKGSYTVNLVGTFEMCEFFQDYLLSQGLVKQKTKIDKRKEEHKVCYTRYGGNQQTLKIMNHLYEGSTVYLDRKYKRYKELCELVSRTRK